MCKTSMAKTNNLQHYVRKYMRTSGAIKILEHSDTNTLAVSAYQDRCASREQPQNTLAARMLKAPIFLAWDSEQEQEQQQKKTQHAGQMLGYRLPVARTCCRMFLI